MITEQTAIWFELNNPVIPYEQMTIETDTKRVKYGDGETAYNDIEYSGFVWRNNHLEVEGESEAHFIDTIIDDNEFILRDREITGNSIIIKDIV